MKKILNSKFSAKGRSAPGGQIPNSNVGQSLIEILVAITLAAVFLGGAVALIVTFTGSNKRNQEVQTAIDLGNDLTDSIRVLANSDWNAFYQLNTGSSNHYTVTSTPALAASSTLSGGETVPPVRGITYTRWFYVDKVYRDVNGNIASGASGNIEDPSTRFVVVQIQWTNNPLTLLNLSEYLTRTRRDEVFRQSDWSGGYNQEIFPGTDANNRFSTSTNIDYSSSSGSLFVTPDTSAIIGSLTSSVFDAQSSSSLNSIVWMGSLGGNASVQFQIASSTSQSGPWTNYVGCTSVTDPTTCNTVNQFTPTGPNSSWAIPNGLFNSTRYFRYKIFIVVNGPGGSSPRVDDVIINYSP